MQKAFTVQPGIQIVDDDIASSCHSDLMQQARRVVDLAISIHLISHHIQNERVSWRHRAHERGRVSLVEFKHGNVCVESA
ncbi:hypothetical protein N136_00415 [Leifsonia aquatica ATCC 14665]|uniref:Uncharacterized protein n=1 Tax=Leifsonia aquatica ATCC 14665 TaxID=1358026 RepID=U2T6W1_LEIAQ|nr:hypothetical protein N136_00415 [Leifsonia aquatica ATCC 14665]